MTIKQIRSEGTRGKVKGKIFLAVARKGMFVLHSEDLALKSGKPLRYAINQVEVVSLDDAADLLIKGKHHIRLYNVVHNQWNLRAPSKVQII